ncbi:hypothetical protein [Oleiagrimonas soli]|uniref:Uncharacterized protein n=1 Tax=Oleiagrimonas soli TaxID=1543381 RepID=A0A099CS58_9GAMM|nr:hypothetical protein [Oleiagrimonas soli]KGI76843.1 hypothetical protein LF63_0113000 [Oleiagrimonas soli]MBB6185306.1 hypothetical protein [Oleiagrimonas soli]
MARGQHHRIHAQDRLHRNRQRVAQEAARLMSEHGIRDFHHAKLKAAERMGVDDEQALPRNREIEQALRERQRIFHGHEQPQALRRRREAAREAMGFLARFEPRLVGAVLDGTADSHSAVCLHLFCDEPEAVPRFLEERGIPYEVQSRRLRETRERSGDYPVYLFRAEELPFDLTVFPRDALRQAPLGRIDERPMERASLSVVDDLLTAPDSSNDQDFEDMLTNALGR